MGHVVNPISFRLNKTKFCFNIWTSASKLRYTHLFLNDLSLNKFIYWYLSTFNGLLLKSNLLINNLKIIRSNINILININFSEILEYKKKKRYINNKFFKKKYNTVHKRTIYNEYNKEFFKSKYTNTRGKQISIQNKYNKNSFKSKDTRSKQIHINNKFVKNKSQNKPIRGNSKTIKHSKFHKKDKFKLEKKWLQSLPKLLLYLKFKKSCVLNYKVNNYAVQAKNKLKLIRSKKKLLKYKNINFFFIKSFYAKKRFFFRKFFLYQKKYKCKKNNSKIFLKFFKFFFMIHKWYFSKIFKNEHKWSSFLKSKKRKKRKLYLFIKIFKFQLTNILKCFFNFVSKNFQINIFILKKVYYANILSKFIQTKLNQGFMLKYLTKKLNYKLNSRNNNILGYKLYYCGRSSKKLRNFPDMWTKGYLGLSNPLVPLEYSQIALWTKKGIVGLKIWLLKKKKIINVF